MENNKLTEEQKFHYFQLGFEKGKQEQKEEDFPDVGFRFSRTASDHFEELIKKEKN